MLFYNMLGIPQLTEENISHIFGSLYIYIWYFGIYFLFIYIWYFGIYFLYIYIWYFGTKLKLSD